MSASEPIILPIADIQAGAKYGKRVHRLLEHLRSTAYDRDDLWQFLAFAMGLAPRSKSGLFQDLWALWVSGQKRGGYFVEFGAADGVSLSNTYLLETEMGWRGLLAEPNPAFAKSLKRNRRCTVSDKCVYWRSGQQIEFLAPAYGELSRIAEIDPMDGHEHQRNGAASLTVETITLNDLLAASKAPSRIDFMSVDTEGSEYDILKAFDFGGWDVGAIAVEHNGTPAREKIHELLSGVGFRRMWPELSRYDDWYVKD